MNYVIREATMRDADEVVSMITSLHRENEANGGIVRQGERTKSWLHTVLGEAIGRKCGLVLVAEWHRKLLGATVIVDTELPYDSPFKKIGAGIGTYVDPEHRKSGIAADLYEAASKLLKERGYDAYLGARLVKNDKAKGVVERAGFVPFEVSVLKALGD